MLQILKASRERSPIISYREQVKAAEVLANLFPNSYGDCYSVNCR
ncbi:hypothetical protein [Gloeocapsa sp. PCC 73106]|nr:hypothetical protein [Gloeocapsa sp. PCC 73106]